MIRFTAHLALIAYLVGGWLLPATHYHGHASRGAACGCVAAESVCLADASAQGGELPLPELASYEHDHDGCCCGDENARLLLVADENLTVGHTAVDCQGLCALCCTVSLVGQVVADPAAVYSPLASAESLVCSGLAWPLPPLRGGISLRGPPTV